MRIDSERPNQVLLSMPAGEKSVEGRIAFLDEGIVRVTLDPTGEFAPYARPLSPDHLARIQAQPDDSDAYARPAAVATEEGGELVARAGGTSVRVDPSSGMMAFCLGGRTVLRETAPVRLTSRGSTQTLELTIGERFFGGGTQNGRVDHAGSVVRIVTTPMNSNQWGDGGVASPSPFFWSSAGYGVLRNTFAPGSYDFGATGDAVVAEHDDPVFDAYVFLAEPGDLRSTAQSILRAYYRVTGAPALLPEFAFYLGHLNAYNRDAWSREPEGGAQAWTVRGSAPVGSPGVTRYELGRRRGYVVPEGRDAESLNGEDEVLRSSAHRYRGRTPYEFSARAVVDEHARYDMPLGWILPNDGYGAGYGHNGYEMTGGVDDVGQSSPERLAAIAANVDNLASFSAYANERGVEVGLWAQSQITPSSDPSVTWQNLRDFHAEVSRAGVRALKTDEEWVGDGYSFGLSATRQGHEILSDLTGQRPFVLTLDGWAGTQRYAAVWSGDQDGSDWEYIRMHVPTYVGQGLSGNPNVGSDVDGIFGGSEVVATRDFQWKALTPIMLDMDGWGTLPKLPYAAGDPHTGIRRMYLKLKSRLMPYILTCAASASCVEGWQGNDDLALPMVRSVLLEDGSARGEDAEKYEFLLGDALLVAPVWRAVSADAAGNDVRDGIYLPGTENDVWVDWFTGERHVGGQVLDGFDAPLWKLPLFVREGAIVPCYEAHNNPRPAGPLNPGGLDRTRRVVEFWPAPGESRFAAYEDDGRVGGGHVTTAYTCRWAGGEVALLAEPWRDDCDGFDPLRVTTFRATVRSRPARVSAWLGDEELELVEVADAAALAAEPAPGTAAWLYEEAPAVETFAPEEERALADMVAGTHGAPRVSVRFPRANVAELSQRVVLLD